MQWHDEAVVLGARRHGETSAILELMTRAHGRHLGLVRGGRSSRQRPILQPGNSVAATWRARLDEHLGHFTIEGTVLRAARLMASPLALHGFAAAAELLRLLPERDPHPAVYETLAVLAEHIDDADVAPPLLVRFELAMLAELGVGLDLTACALTGATQELTHVSPKSGRAVSALAAAPYLDRLFALPAFLKHDFADPPPTGRDVAAGFALTGHFLTRYVMEPRGAALPEARCRFLDLVGRWDGA